MSEIYEPDCWVIVKIKDTHKVVAGWSGGYLHGNSWRVNSGIKKLENKWGYYLAHGYSGSIYKLRKSLEGARASIHGILSKMIDLGGKKITAKTLEKKARRKK